MIISNSDPKSEIPYCKYIMKTIWSVALLWFLSFLYANALWAKEAEGVKSVVVMGTGKIQKNDTAAAKDIAIKESLMSAVSLIIAGIMPVEMISSNFFKINEVIYGQTGQFIQGYRVLSETKYYDNYRVMVEANIAVGRLKAHLSNIGIDPGKKDLPKILFLMSERNIGDEKAQYWWRPGIPPQKTVAEKAMAEIFQQLGFNVIKPETIPSGINSPDLDTPEPLNEAAVALAKHFQADILIIGSAYAEPAANSMGGDILSYTGTVSARAIWTLTGEETGVTYKNDVGVGADPKIGGREALTRAGNGAGEDIGSQLLAALKTKKKQAGLMTIEAKGAHLLNHFIKLRKAVAEISDVQNIQIVEMKADEAMLTLNYPGDTGQLAKALLQKPFDGFGINISTIGEDRLIIDLIPSAQREAPIQKERSMP